MLTQNGDASGLGPEVLHVELRADGEMINRSDIYIAGTARSLGVPLVVNDDHFAAIDDLDVETYRK